VQLKKLPARTRACQDNAARLTRRLEALDGLSGPFVPGDRTSVHHKFRVTIDRDEAGLGDFEPCWVRDAIVSAMRATGFEVTLWERTNQTAQAVFRKDETAPAHLRENYSAEFPRTQRLLDSSFILFTQSCPLIAQTAETVDAYADALEELWQHRRAIVESYDPS
jgi:dTDP-4-amino-4,6-dideoxygalactose transaminase